MKHREITSQGFSLAGLTVHNRGCGLPQRPPSWLSISSLLLFFIKSTNTTRRNDLRKHIQTSLAAGEAPKKNKQKKQTVGGSGGWGGVFPGREGRGGVGLDPLRTEKSDWKSSVKYLAAHLWKKTNQKTPHSPRLFGLERPAKRTDNKLYWLLFLMSIKKLANWKKKQKTSKQKKRGKIRIKSLVYYGLLFYNKMLR